MTLVDKPLRAFWSVADDYQELANKHNITLVEAAEFKAQISTWQCPEGHIFKAAYSNLVRKKTGCAECFGNGRKTEQNYHSLAKKKGIIYLGPFPATTEANTTWGCDKGHEWQLTYAYIQQRYAGCKLCAHIAPERYEELAKDRGLKVVNIPPFIKDKATFECSKGHTFDVSYSHLINRKGMGCAACHGNQKKTEADYHALAEKRGGATWHGPMPQNIRSKTLWQCKNGHLFMSRFNLFKTRDADCLECSDNPMTARQARNRRLKANLTLSPEKKPSPVPEPQNLPSRWLWAFGRQVDYRMRGWVGG